MDKREKESCVTGAFFVKKINLNNVVVALRKRRLLKKNPNVTVIPGSVEEFAVHVNGDPFPTSLLEDVAAEGGRWVPEYRVYSELPLPVSLPSAAPSTSRFRFVELFAGIGGFRVGLEAVGGNCVFASELGSCARSVYAANAPVGTPLFGDIREIPTDTIPDHEVLTAGFPCQSFCKVGDQTGLADRRGNLFFEIIRILLGKCPKAFLLENVEHLLAVNNGKDFDAVQCHLRDAGYHVSTRVIDSAVVVPQTRKRLYFVGFRTEEALQNFAWPSFSRLRTATVRDVLEKVPECSSLFLTSSQLATVSRSASFKKNPEWRISNLNGTARTLMSSYRQSYKMYAEFVPVETAEGQRLRFYSVRECLRLQGFPETFRVAPAGAAASAGYRLVGNAVCPLVVSAIGEAVVSAIEKGGANISCDFASATPVVDA